MKSVAVYNTNFCELDRFVVREERYKHEFKNYLDKDGSISVGTFRANPSYILAKVSMLSFRRQYKKWYISQIENIFSVVMEEYPYPLAYFAFMVMHGYDNETHRLQLLRSLWEAVIQLLFTIIVDEFRQTELGFNTIIMPEGNALKGTHCKTDSMGRKIDISRCILKSAREQLPISSFLLEDEYVFDRLFILNRERNDMQHGYALGELESQDIYNRLVDTVKEVLFDLRKLSQVRCLKFRRIEGRDVRVYAEYRGYSGKGKDVRM